MMKTQPPQTDPSAGTQAEVKLHIQDGGLWLVTMGANQTIGYLFDQGACYSALPCDEYLALPSWDNRPVEEYDVIARGSVKTCVDALVKRANVETWPTGLLAMFERFAQLSSPRLIPNTYHSTPEAAIERTHLLTNIPEEIKRLEAFADLGADKLMAKANVHPLFEGILSRHLAGREAAGPLPVAAEPTDADCADHCGKRKECGDQCSGWGCTRPAGHAGLHVAHAGPTHLCAWWEDDTIDGAIEFTREQEVSWNERGTLVDAGHAAANTDATCAAKLTKE